MRVFVVWLPSAKLWMSERSWTRSEYVPAVEDVDVLAVRVGEIDREAGPDGADQQRRVGAAADADPNASGRRSSRRARRIAGGSARPMRPVN